MEEFENDLVAAGEALEALAIGPGAEAAESLERAFGRAGENIQRVLGQAARSGELDFRRMSEVILRDLARIAAEAVIARTGLGAASQTINVNVPQSTGSSGGTDIGSIATAIASAAARGGRFV